MTLALIASAALALPATTVASPENAGMFERMQLADDLSMVTYSIVRDTRCADSELCFQDEELTVGVVINWRGKWKEYPVTLGRPLPIANGWLTLLGTSAKPQLNGAIRLSEYRMSYSFER